MKKLWPVAAAGLAVLGFVISPAFSVGTVEGAANLWVDGNGGSCTRQAVAGAYNDGQACGSFNAAYQAAQPGDLILVRGGTYGEQTIQNRALTGAVVTLRPAPSEGFVVDGLFDIRTHDFVVDGGDQTGVNETDRIAVYGEDHSTNQNASDQGMDIGWGNNSGNVTNVIVEDVHMRNGYFDDDSTGNTIRYSEVGPSNFGNNGNVCSDLVQSGDARFNVEYNVVHGETSVGCPGTPHIDGMDLNPMDGAASVVRGNRVYDCATQCIFTGDPGTILVENNMVDWANGAGIAVMGVSTIRYNTVRGGMGYGRETDRPGNATVYGNIFLGGPGCSTDNSGVVVVQCDHNISTSGSGGTNAKTCTPQFSENGPALFHLSSSDTCAVDAGDPARFPVKDFDEQDRAGVPDAGADEVGGAPPPPPPPPPPPTTTTTTTTTPPPPAYHPACEPTCDEQIAQLTQERDDARADAAAKQQQLDAWTAWEAQHP